MPNHEEHCRHSEQRYGVRGDDIHTWMDEPSYILGRSHRDERHDPRRDLPIVIQMFGDEYGDDVARQIFLDHIYLDKQERERNQLSQNEPSQTYNYSTNFPSGSDWGFNIIRLILAGFLFIILLYAFNNAFGNPIGLWWAENWYKVVGFSIFVIILGILFLYYWKKRS
jgi:hypothetical protein